MAHPSICPVFWKGHSHRPVADRSRAIRFGDL